MIEFLAHLDNIKTIAERDNHIISIRAFMKFLCERKELQDCSYERWINLFRLKRPVSKKIPSVYTQEEVERIIAFIDRISAIGKRNYAMILLCARYGLRAIDVVGMSFASILSQKMQGSYSKARTGASSDGVQPRCQRVKS